MDVISYLIGKNTGGGSTNNYNVLIDNTLTYSTSNGIKSLIKDVKTFDTTGLTTLQSLFSACTGLTEPPILDTSNITSLQYCFQSCTSLTKMVQWDTKEVTTMTSCFYGCTNLQDVPILDTSALTTAGNMFNGCNNLTNESLDNILQMCINAKSYTATKTLNNIGIKSSNYSQAKIEALPHYNDFITAGWTTGYN